MDAQQLQHVIRGTSLYVQVDTYTVRMSVGLWYTYIFRRSVGLCVILALLERV